MDVCAAKFANFYKISESAQPKSLRGTSLYLTFLEFWNFFDLDASGYEEMRRGLRGLSYDEFRSLLAAVAANKAGLLMANFDTDKNGYINPHDGFFPWFDFVEENLEDDWNYMKRSYSVDGQRVEHPIFNCVEDAWVNANS